MPEAESSPATGFAAALAGYKAAVRTLIPLAERAAVERIVAVLPDAHTNRDARFHE